jgi:hypothetical protein
MSRGQTMTTAIPAAVRTSIEAEAAHLAACDLRDARLIAKKAKHPTEISHGWRVMKNGNDLGVAFTLEGASAEVARLRRAHYRPDGRFPSFTLRGAGGKNTRPAEFEALCKLLWGDERTGWQSNAAEFLKASRRNVQFWAAEPPATSKPVPYGVRSELLSAVRRAAEDPKERARMEAWIARHA